MGTDKNKKKRSLPESREDRLAAQLRANLMRRKGQARARRESETQDPVDESADPKNEKSSL